MEATGKEGNRYATRGLLKTLEAQVLEEEKKEALKKQNERIAAAWTNRRKVIGKRDIRTNLEIGRVKLESDYTVDKKPRLEELSAEVPNDAPVQAQRASGNDEVERVVKEEVDLPMDCDNVEAFPEGSERSGNESILGEFPTEGRMEQDELVARIEDNVLFPTANVRKPMENEIRHYQADSSDLGNIQRPGTDTVSRKCQEENMQLGNAQKARIVSLQKLVKFKGQLQQITTSACSNANDQRESDVGEKRPRNDKYPGMMPISKNGGLQVRLPEDGVIAQDNSMDDIGLTPLNATSEADTVAVERTEVNEHLDFPELIAKQKKLLEEKDARMKYLEEKLLETEFQLKNATSGSSENLDECTVAETGSGDEPPAACLVAADQMQVVTIQQPQIEMATVDARAKVMRLFPEVADLLWRKRKSLGVSTTDILGTRFVCSAWNNAILDLETGPLMDLRKNVPMMMSFHKSTMIEMTTTFKNLWNTESTGSGHPLQLSHLSVIWGDIVWDAEAATARKLVHGLLQMHGPRFRSYHHESTWYVGISSDLFASTLAQWLFLMPNLEKVSLTHGMDREWNLCRNQNPFPRLAKLKCVVAKNYRPILILTSVLRANDHITDLTLADQEFGSENLCLPNLKRLTLDSCYTAVYSLNAPVLEELTVDGVISGETLAAVERFGKSLQVLSLCCEKPERFPKMSQLKKFTWNVKYPEPNNKATHKMVDLRHFPTAFPVLEDFELWCWEGCCCNKGKTCTYFDTKKFLHQVHIRMDLVSKLWVALPTLKKVVIGVQKVFIPRIIERKFVFIRELIK